MKVVCKVNDLGTDFAYVLNFLVINMTNYKYLYTNLAYLFSGDPN